MSYESPVELLVNLIHEQALSDLDNAILWGERRQTGLCVDKEELIKAINYDRDQYNKGYADGLATAHAIGKWIWDDDGYHCSECFYHAYGETGEVLSGHWRYCPNCGAKMKNPEEEEDEE